MSPDELVARLPAGPMDRREVMLFARLLFRFVALNIYNAHRADGRPLANSDLIGVKEWFDELADATGVPARPRATTTLDFCPDCGHIHIDDSECGFPIGGGRICRCERQVPA